MLSGLVCAFNVSVGDVPVGALGEDSTNSIFFFWEGERKIAGPFPDAVTVAFTCGTFSIFDIVLSLYG